ncbi:ATP synthase subunit C [Solemya velum gill symbiont]|uniref:A0A1-type ATP synthase, A1 subunit K n=1 Tax=Solemya velum gill symbiont TaxID=2340 RepID=A0A0B0HF31_SOVGS|nr:ATP synthase subunit C [Solemya velum gill symbiont]KHF26071.1 A0A1-type ATP synthase, A1 subunit K [Solemya velum gill symbiont]OOY41313.1 H+transporting two-sector ATPase C subunit [Solemya velum gill symbiont]OOY47690.1 H+transporting two-sector ATPase C subunit [Solemya velum gill symbiont]OOY59488.1 H+transporting two-sector ATPase C subunit [Solemya velum gill symbiont]OOY60690.1 H+transporting two-sector ATPase C subunit [Solemya velum gill symbiont]
MKRHNISLLTLSGFSAVVAIVATLLLVFGNVNAEESVPAVVEALPPGVVQWGFLAAALATGLSALGAGIAVASVGSAAIGALAEKPELLGRSLIIIGLAEGIAIYGLIISILILNKVL